MVNATFSNISAISWQPALVVEEAGVHENAIRYKKRQCKGKYKLRSHNASYCLKEVGAKASLTVPLIFPNFMSLGHGNL